MKKALIVGLLILSISIPWNSAFAKLGLVHGGISIAPHDEDDAAEKRSWLLYQINPGDTIIDKVDVTNMNKEEVEVRLYAVDAYYNKENKGEFIPKNEIDEKSEAGKWIKIKEKKLTLQPDETQIVSFSMTIPKDIRNKKDYWGSIIAQRDSNDTIKKDNQIVRLSYRVGVRLLARIPSSEGVVITERIPQRELINPIVKFSTADILKISNLAFMLTFSALIILLIIYIYMKLQSKKSHYIGKTLMLLLFIFAFPILTSYAQTGTTTNTESETTAVNNGSVVSNPATVNSSATPDKGVSIMPIMKNAETRSWFVYNVWPGAVIEDKAEVINNSDREIIVDIYPVDAEEKSNKAFLPESEDDNKDNIGKWITLEAREVHLAPREKISIGFTLLIPEDIKAEKDKKILFTGAIMVQENQKKSPQPKISTYKDDNFIINFASRVGARVYASLYDKPEIIMSISKVEFLETDENEKKFLIAMANDSSMPIRPDISLTIKNALTNDTVDNIQKEFANDIETKNSASMEIPWGKKVYGDFIVEVKAKFSDKEETNEVKFTIAKPVEEVKEELTTKELPGQQNSASNNSNYFIILIGAFIIISVTYLIYNAKKNKKNNNQQTK